MNRKRNRIGSTFAFICFVAGLFAYRPALAAEGDRLLDWVNPLQGTDSNIDMSHGGTLPLVAPPWPMTHWSPQTNTGMRSFFDTGGWWFQSTGKEICGFRATHQPSPWMGDYGQFMVMPQTGELKADLGGRASEYDQASSTFKPDYVRMQLAKFAVDAEMTASERCGVMRFTFTEGDTGRIIFDPAKTSHIEIEGRTLRGYTTANNGGVPKNWKAYFVLKLDRDPTGFGGVDDHGKVSADAKTIDGEWVKAYLEFKTTDQRAVNVSIGTSYISYEQAEQNIKAETDGGFDATRTRTADAWEKNLGRIKITGGTVDQRRTFYSCLYRAQTFPHKLHEINAVGKPIHFSVYDGKLHDGPSYGDIGFWDVYRTNFSLWSLVFPEQLQEILNAFVITADESGWMPQWPSPGHRSGMIGSHVDAVYADAIAKNIGGFDKEKAYAAVRKNAFEVPPAGNIGRSKMTEYLKLGYVPSGKDAGYTVSESLDYAYDNWCVAQVAKALGKTEDYDTLMKTTKNYEKLWDPEVGFFRPKKADGTWFGPFDQFAWSNGYVEGGAWQCTWAVQHDIDGLADLMGGREKMAAKLDQMMGLPPIFHIGGYGKIIHEMTEMAVVP
ncbi:MAG: Alpha,2-mannosidase, partial [Phycisphaerales bacterium]|nr:Alpha,2-mannosidase [Phycisphaerales bacterium]